MKTLKEKIVDLKAKGLINSEIAKRLSCSKGVVGYHVTPRIRHYFKLRHKKWKRKNVLAVKLHNFKYQSSTKRGKYGVIRPNEKFTLKTLTEKIGPDPKCYLTGVPIDLDDREAYSLNHIVPHWQGGRNTLENCGLATTEATQAKGAMTQKQFVELCRMVVGTANQATKGITHDQGTQTAREGNGMQHMNETTQHTSHAREFQEAEQADAALLARLEVSACDIKKAHKKSQELLENTKVTPRVNSEDGTRVITELLREKTAFEILEAERPAPSTAHSAGPRPTTGPGKFHSYLHRWLTPCEPLQWLDQDVAAVLLLELHWQYLLLDGTGESTLRFEPRKSVCGQRFGAERTLAALALLEEYSLAEVDSPQPENGNQGNLSVRLWFCGREASEP